MHLAQFNVARMLYPLDDPRMDGFVDRLDELNALADRSPGFVWRLQDDEGTATSIRPVGDDMLITLWVWQSAEAHNQYTYKSAHLEPFMRRQEWFTRPDGPHLVLWFVEEGHEPTLDESAERLAHLGEHGPDDFAFTFGTVPKG